LPATKTTVERATPPFLSAVSRWFLESGIQEKEGGVARYYLMDEQRNARISTEITGYALSTFLYLHRVTDDERHRDAADRAGRFLCDLAWETAAATFPFEWSRQGPVPENRAYFFDCGIIARGLMKLHRATGRQEYLDRAHQCAEAMLRDFVNAQDIHPILELPSKRPVERDGRWSRSPGCYQLKSALAWLEVSEKTGDRRFMEAFEAALQAAMSSEDGFLEAEPRQERVMDRLHAYSYYLEGLLPRGERPEVRQALAKGIEKAARYLREVRPLFERSDVNAQLLRVRLHAAQSGAVAFDETAAAEEAAWTARFQMETPDLRTDGSFCFGRKEDSMLPFANPVSSGFSLQALWQWRARVSGEPLDWRELI
jgi:hypothetical protein